MKLTDIIAEASIRSITPVGVETLSDGEKAQSYKKLSATEVEQLSQPGYVPYELWPTFRRFLVDRSLASNSQLDVNLTAYTPGETIHLLNHPEIQKWHSDMINYNVPDEFDKVIFVPCAKTKPWENACRGLYKDYNKLKNEHTNIFFVTISEPLGIVPQTMWGSFPQYDNPGLFTDTVQRSGGLFTRDFKRLFNSDKQMKVPFDPSAYKKSISILGGIIKKFIDNNPDKEYMSFVADQKGVSTHSDMLATAGFKGNQLMKREKPRQGPYSYIKSHI
jgi:hypothetical protein